MDITNKRKIFFAVLVSLIIGLFVLRSSIFNGTLVINGEAPYAISIPNQADISCFEDPCILELAIGRYDLLIIKEGHHSIILDTKIPLWRSTEITPVFQALPKLFQAQELPVKESNELSFTIDPNNNYQRLNDQQGRLVTFFPQELTNPEVFTDQDFALIISDDSAYKIDLLIQSKERITFDLPAIQAAKWSPDGSHILILDQGQKLQLINFTAQTVTQLDLKLQIEQIEWLNQNRLIFSAPPEFSFQIYDVASGEAKQVAKFSEVTQLPSQIIARKNGKEIYFQMEDQVYKIILEKI